jgi:hypothetical protein
MCNVNKIFKTIGATRTYMFSNFTIGCKILWRSIKMMESAWGAVFCCSLFGLSKF